MAAFLKVPSLDWMREAVQLLRDGAPLLETADQADECLGASDRLDQVYRYLLWSHRYKVAEQDSDIAKVCLGMLTKYHRKVYGLPLSAFEQKMIKEANIKRKEILAGMKG